ncbi:hypothetical protein [Fluviicola taffensis]|uniref:hypothetical protein n=1 Tax=Fluviicola taffensis TaxID=191579 RepID=UPI0005B620BE|nr:hypothetical protein [Fluviicola taffensis]
MTQRLKILSIALFVINGIYSCSTESEVKKQSSSPLSAKDYIAEGETDDCYVTSAEELKIQFHGCKAHQ